MCVSELRVLGDMACSSQAVVLHAAAVQPSIQVLEKIGSGSFGIVQKALIGQYGRGQQICAVKQLIHPPQLQDGKTLDRFKQECSLMSEMAHENIVRCFGIFHLDQPILIMELMECNLIRFLESPRRFYIQVNIVTDILQALVYLHSHDIIHRDLSAANTHEGRHRQSIGLWNGSFSGPLHMQFLRLDFVSGNQGVHATRSSHGPT